MLALSFCVVEAEIVSGALEIGEIIVPRYLPKAGGIDEYNKKIKPKPPR
jgi:hypothetical protein